ncbi:MAG: Holliday junction resolvase RuvX [Wenzhouxiangellaceae bacterium]
MPDHRPVLSFDHGLSRTGVAIGESLTGTARPLLTLRCQQGQPDWQQLDRLIGEWRPQLLLVGLPLALDGSRTPRTRACRRFAAQLGERYSLPVELHDERLSSHEANSRFIDARRNGHARRRDGGKLDAVAACVIFESWLSLHATDTERNHQPHADSESR